MAAHRQTAEGKWARTGPCVVLVNETSATHSRPGEDLAHNVQAIDRTHSDMVKFSRRDEAYNLVLSFIQEFADAATAVVEARFRAKQGIRPLLLTYDAS